MEEKTPVSVNSEMRQDDLLISTPVHASLHEPLTSEVEKASELREQLIERLNADLTEYVYSLNEFCEAEILGTSSEISAMAGAHYYLTERHNYRITELEYLLKFQNPLQVVADQFALEADIEDHSTVMWAIFDRQDALHCGYALAPQPYEVDTLKQELLTMLDKNMSDYRESILSADKQEIFDMAKGIASRHAVLEYMKTSYDFQAGEIANLLRLDDPLGFIAERWPDTLDGLVDMSGAMSDILEDTGTHNQNVPIVDILSCTVTESVHGQEKEEKQSIMDKIRSAREQLKTNPAPRKESRSKDAGPEL